MHAEMSIVLHHKEMTHIVKCEPSNAKSPLLYRKVKAKGDGWIVLFVARGGCALAGGGVPRKICIR